MPESAMPMPWPKITLLGDSITRRAFDVDNGCWASMIAHKVQPYFDLDNRGFDGYNSKWCLELMPKLFPKSYLENVSLFIPFLGHNDSWSTKPLRVDPEEYEPNMRSIIDYLLRNGLTAEKIIMITPTWYHHPDHAKHSLELGRPVIGKDFEDAKKYSDIIKNIALDYKIDVIDFFKISSEYKPLEKLFYDGLHYSTDGARLFFEHLWPVIEKKITSQYGKNSIEDFYHVVPVQEHPEVLAALRLMPGVKF